ncbi:cingulin-like protein 1 [Haliotis cracherodii]|uniref:cingulin-like protein 1 n=1 Tax=Haliotis cracherodii TaxID=6455 RepID=UPI0039ED502C
MGGVEPNPGPDSNDGVQTRSTAGGKGGEKQLTLSSKASEKTLQTVLDELREVSCKINKIQRSNDDMNLKLQTVESTLKVVLEQIFETNNRCQALEEENFRLKDQMKAMDDKLDYLENMSRRNNLIFHGVSRGNETESWTDCELIVKDVLRNDLQLLDDVNIQRAHRMKGKAIIVKLADDKDKHAILRASKALKDTGMFITEDFSPLVRQKRKKLLPKMFQAR